MRTAPATIPALICALALGAAGSCGDDRGPGSDGGASPDAGVPSDGGTPPAGIRPRQSGTVAVIDGARRVAVVVPDDDAVLLHDWDAAGRFERVRRIPTPRDPRTVTVWGPWLLVPCQRAGVVLLVRHDAAVSDPAPQRIEVPMPYGSRPYGAVGAGVPGEVGAAVFVTLAATGQVGRIELDGSAARLVERLDVVEDPRGIALLADGRLAVTRWRSPDAGGEVGVLDPGTGEVETWTLAVDPEPPSPGRSGGVPSYLDQALISPDGARLALPSLQAAMGEGLLRSGRPLTPSSTVRAAVSFIDPATGDEEPGERVLFDHRGFAAAAAFSHDGRWLFVAMRGSRAVDRLDTGTGEAAGAVEDVGFAPQGLALSEDDGLLFVDASLSRELVVYDVASFGSGAAPLWRLPLVDVEPLEPLILLGAQVFSDSADPRISADGYIACAHCHLEALHDGRTWDFTDRGEGLRNTISLAGWQHRGSRPIHWSANFDEVQDFEHDIRNAFGGTGLMSDADFHTGTRDETLGDRKAGVSEALDSLEAFLGDIGVFAPSPHRGDGGSLTARAERGRALFLSPALGCLRCHGDESTTDSAWVGPREPLLHDVGTLGPGSGLRLGGALKGVVTPPLHGLWDSAPYLHDGSAATLQEVLRARNPEDEHGVTNGLSDGEVEDLVEYLLSLDGRLD